jgi:hypothetical protein
VGPIPTRGGFYLERIFVLGTADSYPDFLLSSISGRQVIAIKTDSFYMWVCGFYWYGKNFILENCK